MLVVNVHEPNMFNDTIKKKIFGLKNSYDGLNKEKRKLKQKEMNGNCEINSKIQTLTNS